MSPAKSTAPISQTLDTTLASSYQKIDPLEISLPVIYPELLIGSVGTLIQFLLERVLEKGSFLRLPKTHRNVLLMRASAHRNFLPALLLVLSFPSTVLMMTQTRLQRIIFFENLHLTFESFSLLRQLHDTIVHFQRTTEHRELFLGVEL